MAGVCPVSYAIYRTSLHPGGILGGRTATGCDPGTLAESAASAVAYGPGLSLPSLQPEKITEGTPCATGILTPQLGCGIKG